LKNTESDDLEKARAFFVVANQSYHSRINSLSEFNWKICIKDSTKNGSSAVSKYNSKKDRLNLIAGRFKAVQIENRDFKKIFDKFDSDVSFFYVDPPYPTDTRRTKKLYDYELDDDRHSELLEIITSLEGSVLISTYQNEMYDSKLADWKKVTNPEKRIRSSSTKRKAAEIVYRNYELQEQSK
jgi:DNA adenine methylase